MKRLVLLPVLLALVVWPSAAQAVVNDCGNWGDHGDGEPRWGDSKVYGAGIFNLRARDVGCAKARRLSRFGIRPSRCNADFTLCRVGSFRCRSKQSYEYARFFCRNPKERIVRWETGS